MHPTSPKYLQVTAALIPSGGRFFIAQRPAHKAFGLCWEFPGGKVEPGETLEESLHREIREELGWEIQVGKHLHTVRCSQPALDIDLHAFWCSIAGGNLWLREHVEYRWARIEELNRYRLTEPDRHLVAVIKELPRLLEKSFY